MEVYNVCFIGDKKIGKTALIKLITDNIFIKEYIPTIGVDVSRYVIKKIINKQYYKIKLNLIEISGQERFKSLIDLFIKNSSIIILCFNISIIESFEKIKNDFNNLNLNSRIIFLIGLKNDLINDKKIDINLIKNFSKLNNLYYFELNLSQKKNIEEFLYILLLLIYANKPKQNLNIQIKEK